MGDPQPLKQIVAIGGGGFSMEPDNPLLDRYVLGLSNLHRPRICFLPTASGDSDRYIVKFYTAFLQQSCIPCHLSLFNPSVLEMRDFILSQDIIYVGGGNTKNLIALWQAWGLDQILKAAWEKGVILCGLSAGSLCWFESGISDFQGSGILQPLNCLGLLPGSHSPHYDAEVDRRPMYQQLIASGVLPDGYAADDGVALHFVGTHLATIVSSRPQAKAYRLEKKGEKVMETVLQPIYLGD